MQSVSSTAARPGDSWMLPEAQGENLVYVTGLSNSSYAVVYVYSFPAGKLVGQISRAISGLCADAQGDVFMTQSWYSASRILEYKHGGTKPIAALQDPYKAAVGCAVDPKTGDLAVANYYGSTVLVYPHGRGKPTTYLLWFGPYYAAYDDSGHLFVYDGILAELGGNGKFYQIKYPRHASTPMGIQWDGEYLALGEGTNVYNYGEIERFTISGHNGVWHDTVSLDDYADGFFIDGSKVLVTNANGIDVFNYPQGGEPIQKFGTIEATGQIVLSLAP